MSPSGAAAWHIPVRVPPGRNGIAPDLFLSYDGQGRAGIAGEGWNVEPGSVRRSMKRGVDYGAREFVVSGARGSEELVPREADWGTGFYGAKIEEAFVKYRYDGSAWEAIDKDGRRYFYGTSSSSRQGGPEGVYRWCLDAVEDSNGNRVEIRYERERGEIYPASVSWPGSPGTVEAVFVYEGRPDAPVSYGTGFSVTTARRLRAVEVYAGRQLCRRYILAYESGNRSRLASVTEYGSGGESLPAARFAYREGGTGGYGSPVTGATACLMPVPEVHFVEVNGDGKTDLLVLERDTTEVRALSHLSRGNGSFGSPGTFAIPLEHPAQTAFHLGDLNGDGLPDLVAHRYEKGEFTYNGIKAYLALGNGTFGAPVATELSALVSWDERLFFAEMNGDGRDDLVVLGERTGAYRVYLSRGDGTFGVSPFASGSLPGGGRRAYFADVNGDGLSDAVCHELDDVSETSAVHVYLSNGRGSFSPAGGMNLGGPGKEGDRGLRFADADGDGAADLVSKTEVHKGVYRYRRYLSKRDGTFWGTSFGGDVTVSWNEDFVFTDVTGDGHDGHLRLRRDREPDLEEDRECPDCLRLRCLPPPRGEVGEKRGEDPLLLL